MEDSELKRTVALRVPYMTDAEYQLGYLNAGEKTENAIVEAIENRQGTRAEAVAREHARLSRQNLEIVLSDSELLSFVPGGTLIRA